MGKLKVTITHGSDSGPQLVVWMLAAGLFIAAINAQAFIAAGVLAISAGIVTALYIVCGVVSLCAVLWTGVAVYTRIRDRPAYEAIQRDTERNLRAYRQALTSGVPPRPLQRVEATRVLPVNHSNEKNNSSESDSQSK